MPASDYPKSSGKNTYTSIQLKRGNRCPTSRCPTLNSQSQLDPSKMRSPILTARIEQAYQSVGYWIARPDEIRLESVALRAREPKVASNCLTAS